MEPGYTFFYIEANIVCLFIFLMLLVRSIGGVDRQEKQRVFDGMLISHILYFVSDSLWVLILDDVIPRTFVTVAVVNLANALILYCITFFWYVYVELFQGSVFLKLVRHRLMIFIPGSAVVVIIAFLFLLRPDLMVDDELMPTSLYYIMFIVVPVLYIVAAAARSLVRAFMKKNYANRKTYIACAIYPIAVTVFGIVQIVYLHVPLFCFGCTIIMIYIYIVSLDDQVSSDPLTNLNNRAQLKRFVSGDSFRLSDEQPSSYVMMVDLNRFKSINDRYGHVEGDNAIKRTADALRAACLGSRTRPFIARYGGDEFVVIARTTDINEVIKLAERIKQKLIDLNTAAGSEYELTASIGYAKFSPETMSFQDALRKADEALYREKELLKQKA
ncbi:MAG: GGDEF domain-containing protein [Clostridiales bacterium]|nr:GGDEF domain-containing protein [Clostridiales bacterium]